MSRRTVRRSRATALGLAALGTVLGLQGAAAPGSAAPGPTPGAAASTRDACGPTRTKPGGGTWRCTFVDNFDGSRLDSTTWHATDTEQTGFQIGSTCLSPSASNVRVRLGRLVLTARNEGETFTCENPLGPFDTRYTGGHISTKSTFAQVYGRFAARIRFPRTSEQGLHGGFWMYPAQHTYGAWPASGEIDVAEWWSLDPTLTLPSLVYGGRGWFDSGWDCRTDEAHTWRTYAVVWTPRVIRFYQDGALCFRRSWSPLAPLIGPQPFDHPFELVLTWGVGGASGHNAVTPDTKVPASLKVDWVKAWK